MKDEAAANAESDRKAKEEIEKLNTADSMIFTTEKQLTEYGDKIPAEKKTVITTALTQLKEAHAKKDLTGIETAITALNAAWQAASQEMYAATEQQQQQPGQQNPNPGPDNKGGANDPEVTDVDFEEVK